MDQANNGGVTRAKIAKVLGITVEDLERVQRVFAVAKVEQRFKQDYPRVLTGPRRIRRKVRRTRETRASIARVLGLSVSDLARVALLTTQR